MTAAALRVVFFGTPQFAVPTLDHLLRSAHPVAGVVTQPDRPRGRGQHVTEGPVKALAVSRGLPVLQPGRLTRDEFESSFLALSADIGVVVAYGKLLPDWLLASPRLGLVNLHASLLPRHRGASPIHRAIMAGDQQTGVTIMRVAHDLDAGPMLLQARCPIGPDQTTEELSRVLSEMGAPMVVATLDRLAAGPVDETAQDHRLATFAPRLTRHDGLVDWSRSAEGIHNQVRGLVPWPRAHTFHAGARVILHRTKLPGIASDKPAGTIVTISQVDGMAVACGDGRLIEIVDLQFEGKRVLPAPAAAVGGALAVGDRFEQS